MIILKSKLSFLSLLFLVATAYESIRAGSKSDPLSRRNTSISKIINNRIKDRVEKIVNDIDEQLRQNRQINDNTNKKLLKKNWFICLNNLHKKEYYKKKKEKKENKIKAIIEKRQNQFIMSYVKALVLAKENNMTSNHFEDIRPKKAIDSAEKKNETENYLDDPTECCIQ
jgi:hypothetical protein